MAPTLMDSMAMTAAAVSSNTTFTWSSFPLPNRCTAFDASLTQPTSGAYFAVCDETFTSLLGPDPTLEVKIEKDWPFAHEAAVYIPSQDEIYMTSNLIPTNISTADNGGHTIKIGVVTRDASHENYTYTVIHPDVSMGNGGTRYFNDTVLWCAQGTKSQSSGVVLMNTSSPYATDVLVSSYFGAQFNSPNDVVVHPDGGIWFTDPIYGFEQGYRPTPALRQQVYRFDPSSGDVRAVADGFDRPNGLVFSPRYNTLYVTDTGYGAGDGSTDPLRPATIYAFDVIISDNAQFLTNRREFAYVTKGIPDGIKVDAAGNVYSGCGDGIHVWSPAGVLLGVIRIPGGVANFNFGRPGEMFILADTKFYVAKISEFTKGAKEV